MMKETAGVKSWDEVFPDESSLEFPVPKLNGPSDHDLNEEEILRHKNSECADEDVPSTSGNVSPWSISKVRETRNGRDGSKWQKRATLEDDVLYLSSKLDEEINIREVLKQALGRASSSLYSVQNSGAPLKTQELVKDIALLELEVAYLEQHLLMLYRSAFEQQLQTVSVTKKELNGQTSSGILLNREERVPKVVHESILRNNVSCQIGSSLSNDTDRDTDTGNLTLNDPRTRQSTSLHCTPKRDLLNPSSHSQPIILMKDKKDFTSKPPLGSVSQQILPSESSKNTLGQNMHSGSLTDALSPLVKERFCESPNKLSERLVRCMVAIYCKLADPPLQNLAVGPASPSSSSSATTMFSPHDAASSDGWSPRPSKDALPCEFSLNDPYDITGGRKESLGAYNYMVEVPWICVDNDRLTYAARMLRDFRSLVQQLEKVDPGRMKHAEKLAFWINIYNALMMHAYLAYGIPRNHLKRVSLLQKAAYKIGAYSINAHTIEQSILGCRSHRPAQWLQLLLTPGAKFKGDERAAYAIENSEPLVCFALCCGGRSDPAVRVYTSKNIYPELEVAKREFLQASIGIRKENKLLLPRVLEYFSRESLIATPALFEWACQHLSESRRDAIRQKPPNRSSSSIEWVPYNFGFRYIFVRDLARWFPHAGT